MTTYRLMINMALRRLGRLGLGDVPEKLEYIYALPYIKNMMSQLITQGYMGELESKVIDVTDSTYEAKPGEHVFIGDNPVGKVILPEIYSDYNAHRSLSDYGRVDSGNELARHMPADVSLIAVTSSSYKQTKFYIFDAHIASWTDLDDINYEGDTSASITDPLLDAILDQTVPLASRDPAGMASYLALLLADEWAIQPAPMTIDLAQNWKMDLGRSWNKEHYTEMSLRDMYKI